jgi:hypothetical protein
MFSIPVNIGLLLSSLQIFQYQGFEVVTAVTVFWGVMSNARNYHSTRRHHPVHPNINRFLETQILGFKIQKFLY